MIVNAVYSDMYLVEGQMVVIKSIDNRFEILVVMQISLRPVNRLHHIGLCAQIDICLTHTKMSKVGIHTHSISGHMKGYRGLVDNNTVCHDFPTVFRGRRVLWNTIVKSDIQPAVFQSGAIQFHSLIIKVYTPTGDGESPNFALHTGCGYHSQGIDLRTIDFQLTDNHTVVYQRQKLHIHHRAINTHQRVWTSGNRIYLNHLHAINSEIKGEGKVHVVNSNGEARLFRSNLRNLVHHPILNRRQINQYGQDKKQQDGAQ